MKNWTLVPLSAGLALFAAGLWVALSGQAPLRRILAVLAAALFVWGAACAARALSDRVCDHPARLAGGFFYALLGACALVATLWSAAFPARTLGFALFSCGTLRLADAVKTKTAEKRTVGFGLLNALLGAVLMIFASERGAVTGAALMALGVEAALFAAAQRVRGC